MKTPSKPFSRKGFTLVELLVVIAIIAVLASAGFAVGPAMMNRAKKLSAQATATNIANAVEQFYTEYSALPASSDNPSEDPPLNTASGSGVEVIRILAGEDLNSQNPRKIRFLSVKEAKNKLLDGAVYEGNSISKIVDPWGEPYSIVLDYGYDEELNVNPGISGTSAKLNGRRVAVYSLGVKPPATANAKTLVKSW